MMEVHYSELGLAKSLQAPGGFGSGVPLLQAVVRLVVQVSGSCSPREDEADISSGCPMDAED